MTIVSGRSMSIPLNLTKQINLSIYETQVSKDERYLITPKSEPFTATEWEPFVQPLVNVDHDKCHFIYITTKNNWFLQYIQEPDV